MEDAVGVLRAGAIVEDVVFPDIRDYHLRARHHHGRGARHPSPEVIEMPEKFGYIICDAPPLPARRFPDPPSSIFRRCSTMLPQASGRHARRHARLRPGDGANQWGPPEIFQEPQAIFHFLGKPLAQHAVQRHRPARAHRVLRLQATTASRSPSSSPVGRSTRSKACSPPDAAYERATPWRERRHRPCDPPPKLGRCHRLTATAGPAPG